MKQAVSVCVNHAQIRSWNQPVLSIDVKVYLARTPIMSNFNNNFKTFQIMSNKIAEVNSDVNLSGLLRR